MRALLGGLAALAVLAGGCAAGGSDDAAGPAAEQAVALRFVPVVRGLVSPVHVTAPRSERGRLYVVEQPGRIVVVQGGRVRPQPFLDIRSLVRWGGEQGLLAVAFHPRYASNRRFYVDYTDRDGNTRVVEYRSNGTRGLPNTARQLLFVRQPYSNHNGGGLAFGPDGRLYVGMGDGGSGGDPENRAQNPRELLGKLLAIDVDRPSRRRMAALGLRNPWRFSFDRRTSDLWIGDVGQNSWEEVDFLPRRLLRTTINYGWDAWEGRSRYEPKPLGPGRLVQPIAVYRNGTQENCSVTGGFVYRGAAVPAVRGRYFYGDYCSGTIWSLRAVGGRATGIRREQIRVPELTSFGEDARGELFAVSQGGTVYRLAR